MTSPYWLQAAPVEHKDENQLKSHSWVKEDNPFLYNELLSCYASPTPKRHILGVVGGNEVGLKEWGLMRDIESELRGTTRPLTDCPEREAKPIHVGQKEIKYNNRKTTKSIDISQPVLPDMQMWSYPATYRPESLVLERCGKPEKY